MRYYLDCEFIEDGKTIDLISIGIVAEDGRELYMQSVEFTIDKANAWVRENVIMHLDPCPHIMIPDRSLYSLGTLYGAQSQHKQGQCTFEDPSKGIIGANTDCPWRTREQIKREILHFMNPEQYGKPELIGYYSAYDHVAFCQLFGTMMDLPKGFPMLTYDLRQWLDLHGMGGVHQPDDSVHNALADARWVAETYDSLVERD